MSNASLVPSPPRDRGADGGPHQHVGLRGLRRMAGEKPHGPTVAAPVAPARGAAIAGDERLRLWRHLGRILRIQRWYRRVVAERRVGRAIGRQRAAWADEYRAECAETVQRAWRAFVAKQLARRRLPR
jgi:hypothetical protein